MELSGEAIIAAPRAQVWAALNDPALLARSIEGCEKLEPAGENRFEGLVAAKVGPVRAKFGGVVELSNLDPPNGYTLSGEGKGGAAGFARGAADIRLEEVEGGAGTMLTWTARATVGGKLAQLGARLIEGAAKAQAEKFFTAFKAAVERPADAAEAFATDAGAGAAESGLAEMAIADSAPAAPAPPHTASPSSGTGPMPAGGGLSLTSWSSLLAIAVILLLAALLLFGG